MEGDLDSVLDERQIARQHRQTQLKQTLRTLRDENRGDRIGLGGTVDSLQLIDFLLGGSHRGGAENVLRNVAAHDVFKGHVVTLRFARKRRD